MHSRRDLLKFFGIGATIVPVIGGMPELAAPAKLIAEPVLEAVTLVKPGEVFGRLNNGPEDARITIEIVNPSGRWVFSARTLVLSGDAPPVEIPTRGPWREFIPGPAHFEWAFKGALIGHPDVLHMTPER